MDCNEDRVKKKSQIVTPPKTDSNIIHLNLKKPWEVGTGHHARRKAGPHDSRPKRERTRNDNEKKAVEEWD